MFNFFHKDKKTAPIDGTWIYINGNVYSRQGLEIAVLRNGASELEVCKADHTASNGLTIQQIAYAIAIIDRLVAVDFIVPTPMLSSFRQGPGVN